MRLIQEVKVECATQQEFDALVEWIEAQTYCTVEFNAIVRQVANAPIVVSIIPFIPEAREQFEEFAAELQHFVERA